MCLPVSCVINLYPMLLNDGIDLDYDRKAIDILSNLSYQKEIFVKFREIIQPVCVVVIRILCWSVLV